MGTEGVVRLSWDRDSINSPPPPLPAAFCPPEIFCKVVVGNAFPRHKGTQAHREGGFDVGSQEARRSFLGQSCAKHGSPRNFARWLKLESQTIIDFSEKSPRWALSTDRSPRVIVRQTHAHSYAYMLLCLSYSHYALFHQAKSFLSLSF